MKAKKSVVNFGILWMSFGLLPFALGSWGTYQGWLTQKWPRTWATIANADLKVQRRTDYRDGQRRKSTSVSLDIAYIYTVAGIEYWSEGLQPYSFGMQNAATARRMGAEYPSGSRAEIIYSPEDPATSYLEPGPSSVSLFMLGVGGIMTLIGLWVQSLGRRGIGQVG